jgi:hypothetical protein
VSVRGQQMHAQANWVAAISAWLIPHVGW